MKKILLLILAAVAAQSASAQNAPATHPLLTIQQETEIYLAITSCDQGGPKAGSDGKTSLVPFVFSGPTKFLLALDAAALKSKAEAYQAAITAAKAKIDPKGVEATNQATPNTTTNATRQAIETELAPLYHRLDPDTPVLRKIPLADLNLDANPFSFSQLNALQPIIQQ